MNNKENNVLINTEDVSYSYDCFNKKENNVNSKKILNGITLKIKKGEFVAILGANGAGKSTFVKHLNALLIPTIGNVFINGINTKEAKDDLLKIRSKVGMVFQDPESQLINSLVEEDVAFGPENLQVEPEEIQKLVNIALKQVNMKDYKNSTIHELSGGQKQRIATAGILAMSPECLILDEATSMLDAKNKEEILKIICKLNKEYSTTIIMVTHNIEETVFANRVLLIKGGELCLDATPAELFYNDDLLKKYKIKAPKIVEFVKKIKFGGINLPSNILTVEECLSALQKILDKQINV